jgi:crossover junction endodeoxyribonuclease RusA
MQIITLSWPPKQSSPNGSQGDYKGKARAGRDYRGQCLLECIAQRAARMSGPIEAHILFCPPRNGKFDLDNAYAKFKRGQDAVAERIGVDDADWHKITLQRGDKVARGQIVITLKEYRK